MLSRAQALAVAAILLHGVAAFAGDIYRCQVNGVTTFVDSPRGCPEGNPQHQGGDESRETKPQPPRLEEARRGPDTATRARPTPNSPPASPPPTLVAVPPCQKLAQEPAHARECLRAERRAEVRRIASARLAEMGRAVADYVSAVSSAGNIIATPSNGRPSAWCEGILGDLMAQKDIEVVDDETTGGPEWMYSGNGPARSAGEILDPNFKEWNLAGSKVPDGYVTARWRGANLVVLRVAAACTEARDGTARCNAHRLVSIYVYDSATPIACNISEVGRAEWPSWKNTETSIFAQSGRR